MDRVPRNRFVLFLMPAIVGCATDLATKRWFFSWPELRAGEMYWLWPGTSAFSSVGMKARCSEWGRAKCGCLSR